MKRRTLLAVGVGTGALLALAGGTLALLEPGLQQGKLSSGGRAMSAAVASAVLAGLLPADAAARSQALDAHMQRLDLTIAGMPPAAQAEIAELVTLLASPPGRLALAGLRPDWPQAGDEEVRAMLQGLRTSPALLLRSQAPDPHGRLGRRTFLHPVVVSTALLDEPIEGWHGAPLTMCSDHFLDIGPIDAPIGYKLEAPPMHPVLASITLPGFGPSMVESMQAFPRTDALLALLRDGFNGQSPGGQVGLRREGSPLLDYPLTEFVFDGARRALLSMAEIQFAAGAKSVFPAHEMAQPTASWAEAKAMIAALPMKPCADLGVVRPDGRHWQLQNLQNLSVHDGSLFLTSIGANPQLSVYGLVNMLASALAREIGGRSVVLA